MIEQLAFILSYCVTWCIKLYGYNYPCDVWDIKKFYLKRQTIYICELRTIHLSHCFFVLLYRTKAWKNYRFPCLLYIITLWSVCDSLHSFLKKNDKGVDSCLFYGPTENCNECCNDIC